eukprot:2415457-Pyramimonas_sp.AAC.1
MVDAKRRADVVALGPDNSAAPQSANMRSESQATQPQSTPTVVPQTSPKMPPKRFGNNATKHPTTQRRKAPDSPSARP